MWSPTCRADNHSSRTRVTARLQRPTQRLGRAALLGCALAGRSPCASAPAGRPRASLCGLAPGGVCRATPVTGGAVGSYPAVSPLPRGRRSTTRRSVLCCTFLEVTLTGRYPAPCPVEARTFLPRPALCADRRRPSVPLRRREHTFGARGRRASDGCSL